MNIQIELSPYHWWIEKASPYKDKKKTCHARVIYQSIDESVKKDIDEYFETVIEAAIWIEERIKEAQNG